MADEDRPITGSGNDTSISIHIPRVGDTFKGDFNVNANYIPPHDPPYSNPRYEKIVINMNPHDFEEGEGDERGRWVWRIPIGGTFNIEIK